MQGIMWKYEEKISDKFRQGKVEITILKIFPIKPRPR